ncbi:hypothetical protein J7E99_31095 [Streptomyces sp. ISL-44]|uniref:hypothetical protein n=1 Tax=Streptomyces sp. ISL-44 TaxID=2819184 RepID=UPI001BEA2A40|nr:hypothetical protein [Streptomyces sp. ISL-44]MBT2545029.1 hypothetical protein [Streptomyces sp. ISL-44]
MQVNGRCFRVSIMSADRGVAAARALTFVLAWLFGVLLTLLAVRGPAKAAAKVPPVAALGVPHVLGATTPARRVLHEAVSVLMLASGALMLTVGARVTPPVSLLAAT